MISEKFFCRDCSRYFHNPKYYYERHGFDTPPYERVAVCPECGSDDFIEFDCHIEKTEVAQKLLPALMQLNRYYSAHGGNESDDLIGSIEMLAELINDMFEFLDYDMQNKISNVDDELELERILMYLDGEL